MLYKQILGLLLINDVPIWDNSAKTHLNKIKVFQIKVLMTILNALWFVWNEILHKVSQLFIKIDYIKRLSANIFNHLGSTSCT